MLKHDEKMVNIWHSYGKGLASPLLAAVLSGLRSNSLLASLSACPKPFEHLNAWRNGKGANGSGQLCQNKVTACNSNETSERLRTTTSFVPSGQYRV